MKQEDYRKCVARGLSGKTLKPEERKLEFCVVAKLCSKKVSSREEAELICKESINKPKPPKQPSAAKRGSRSCEKQAVQLVDCIVDNIPQDSLCNINKLQIALGNALILCSCHPEEK